MKRKPLLAWLLGGATVGRKRSFPFTPKSSHATIGKWLHVHLIIPTRLWVSLFLRQRTDVATSTLFKSLKHCAVVLWIDWTLYQQLFGSEERVALLNDSGGHLFHVLQQSMLDRFLLGLTRLTDPAKMGKNANLSLAALVEEVDHQPELQDRLAHQLGLLDKSVAALREHRNKRVAHADLAALTDPEAALQGYKITDIEGALNQVAEFLNSYELQSNDSQTAYDQCILPMGHDGERLVRCLKQAEAFRAAALVGMVPQDMWKYGEHGDA